MTKQAHTPGPWKVTTCLDYWVEPANAPDDGGFHGIAHCGDVCWPNHAEKQDDWEANARLIAASPALLEALKKLMSRSAVLATLDDDEREEALAALTLAEPQS